MTRRKRQLAAGLILGLSGMLATRGGAQYDVLVAQSTPSTPSKPDLFSSLVASAASIDMESPVTVHVEFDPPTVALGGRTIYRIVLNALDESVKLPDELPAPKGLELTPGGRAQNYQPVGGTQLQPRTTINIRATPTATGTFTMPAYTLTAYGKAVPVPAARLEVVPAGTPGVRDAPTLLLTLPKGDVYVGQTFRIAVSLLDPGDGSVQALSGARIIGESIFSEPISSATRHGPLLINGQAYPTVSQDVIITPIREGRQTIVGQAAANFNRTATGQSGVFQILSSLVDSDPVELVVKPLPEPGRLPGFSGAVGVFQIDPPKISTNLVRAGDPLTITAVVRGDAGLGRLVMPPLPLQSEWQTFPPVGEPFPPYVIQQRGLANFTYTLIPLSDRIKATPPIPFCYFDPARKIYVDLTIPPMPVQVEPAAPGALVQKRPTNPAGVSPDYEESSGHEPPLVLSGLAETPGGAAGTLTALQKRGWFLALQLVPALALAGWWGWSRRRRFLEEHPEAVHKQRARRGVRRQLQLARRAAATRDAAGFVTGAINTLREACAPHAAANPDALVCGDVLSELPESDRQGRLGDFIRRLFSAADAIRFGGPAGETADLLALQPDFERLVQQLKARL